MDGPLGTHPFNTNVVMYDKEPHKSANLLFLACSYQYKLFQISWWCSTNNVRGCHSRSVLVAIMDFETFCEE